MLDEGSSTDHRSGFIALAGRPNVGKSTLINALLEQHIAAVSSKPQTTQQQLLAILTIPQAQLIFVDTPGIHKPIHKLGNFMNSVAQEAIRDADHSLILFDISEPPHDEDFNVVENVLRLAPNNAATIALNKCDLLESNGIDERSQEYNELLPGCTAIPISSTQPINLDRLLQTLIMALPEGPQFYPPDQITTTYERDIAVDMIRAACLQLLRDEVPYSIAVRIDTFTERTEHGAYIEATLFVERESQKGIVIGKKGQMLKAIGSRAREGIEAATGRKIYLKLRVKVMPGWRNDEQALRRFGYK